MNNSYQIFEGLIFARPQFVLFECHVHIKQLFWNVCSTENVHEYWLISNYDA